jgi:hypothetical protein
MLKTGLNVLLRVLETDRLHIFFVARFIALLLLNYISKLLFENETNRYP